MNQAVSASLRVRRDYAPSRCPSEGHRIKQGLCVQCGAPRLSHGEGRLSCAGQGSPRSLQESSPWGRDSWPPSPRERFSFITLETLYTHFCTCFRLCILQSIKGKTMYRWWEKVQCRVLKGYRRGKVSLPLLRAPGPECQGCKQGTLGGDLDRKANGNPVKSLDWGSLVSAL